jgi:hypothetical protein
MARGTKPPIIISDPPIIDSIEDGAMLLLPFETLSTFLKDDWCIQDIDSRNALHCREFLDIYQYERYHKKVQRKVGTHDSKKPVVLGLFLFVLVFPSHPTLLVYEMAAMVGDPAPDPDPVPDACQTAYDRNIQTAQCPYSNADPPSTLNCGSTHYPVYDARVQAWGCLVAQCGFQLSPPAILCGDQLAAALA